MDGMLSSRRFDLKVSPFREFNFIVAQHIKGELEWQTGNSMKKNWASIERRGAYRHISSLLIREHRTKSLLEYTAEAFYMKINSKTFSLLPSPSWRRHDSHRNDGIYFSESVCRVPARVSNHIFAWAANIHVHHILTQQRERMPEDGKKILYTKAAKPSPRHPLLYCRFHLHVQKSLKQWIVQPNLYFNLPSFVVDEMLTPLTPPFPHFFTYSTRIIFNVFHKQCRRFTYTYVVCIANASRLFAYVHHAVHCSRIDAMNIAHCTTISDVEHSHRASVAHSTQRCLNGYTLLLFYFFFTSFALGMHLCAGCCVRTVPYM